MPDSKMVKARLEEVGGAGSLEFKFNPSEISVSKSAGWNAAPRSMNTKAGGKPEYTGSQPRTVSLQIFFDDWESIVGDVTKQVELLFEWCTPSRLSLAARSTSHPRSDSSGEATYRWRRGPSTSKRSMRNTPCSDAPAIPFAPPSASASRSFRTIYPARIRPPDRSTPGAPT